MNVMICCPACEGEDCQYCDGMGYVEVQHTVRKVKIAQRTQEGDDAEIRRLNSCLYDLREELALTRVHAHGIAFPYRKAHEWQMKMGEKFSVSMWDRPEVMQAHRLEIIGRVGDNIEINRFNPTVDTHVRAIIKWRPWRFHNGMQHLLPHLDPHVLDEMRFIFALAKVLDGNTYHVYPVAGRQLPLV